MQNSALSSRHLLTHYLQELIDAKTQQIQYFVLWGEGGYSAEFNRFLNHQKENAVKQKASLKALAETLNISLSGKVRSPVRNLLKEAGRIKRFSQWDDEQVAAESMVAQLLQGIKHHEMVTGRGALELAYNLEENAVADTLLEILREEENAYHRLRDFVSSRRQNGGHSLTHTGME